MRPNNDVMLNCTATNEDNMANIVAHFDTNMVFSVIDDKLMNLSYISSIIEPNVVATYEAQFKIMEEQYPGDSQNIRNIREQLYRAIIERLTLRFNLQFNTVDDTIDVYIAAYYLYEFLICNRNSIMTNFFVSFIINNKDSIYAALNADVSRKGRDISSNYGKIIYQDPKYVLISANMNAVLNYISALDIRLIDIFRSTYKDEKLLMFLDNAFADKGNFFHDYYYEPLTHPEILPVIITNIKLALQQQVGQMSQQDINQILSMKGE